MACHFANSGLEVECVLGGRMLCHGAVGVGTSSQQYLLPPAFPLYLAAFALGNAPIAGQTLNNHYIKATVATNNG